MNVEQIEARLKANGYTIWQQLTRPKSITLLLSDGSFVECLDTGKVNVQGPHKAEVEAVLANPNSKKIPNNNVFVVYGHDKNARTQLEAMLRRWGMEPLILDQLISSGNTIIQKLEEHTSQANFGVVLVTPDDIGYPKHDETKKRYRARQNVVLELGMLLSSLGRKRVAILISEAEKMERPSDIEGLIYLPFTDDVEEVKVPLAKEMKNNGYEIDIAKL